MTGEQKTPVVILSTAHAAKFENAMRKGLGDEFWEQEMVMPESAQAVLQKAEIKPGCFREGEDWTQKLRELIESHNRRDQLKSKL